MYVVGLPVKNQPVVLEIQEMQVPSLGQGRSPGGGHDTMEFSRQEYWSGLPFPSLGDLPDSGIEPGSLA